MPESSVDTLLAEARSAPFRPGRSKLEMHRDVICELRRKHWTYADIAGWLKMRGVDATTSNVHRFFQTIKYSKTRLTESAPPPPPMPAAPIVPEKPKRKIRFNIREPE
jgi:transposase